MQIKIVNKSNNPMPEYKTVGAAGMDIRADFSQENVSSQQIDGFGWLTVPTGIYMEVPKGYYAQVMSRSGLAFKQSIEAFNGVIDSDYRGEIKVLLKNMSPIPKNIKDGERIAQILIKPVAQPTLTEVDELSNTDRGEGGFGSTGKH